MVDISALQADLESLKPMLEKADRESLVKMKDLCDKLNNQKFDEVIHELFSKEDILKFLSTTSISAGVVVEKDVIKNAVKEAAANFQKGVLYKIFDLSEPDTEAMDKLAEKHSLERDEEGDFTDPKVIKLLEDLDNELEGIEAHCSTLQSGISKAGTEIVLDTITVMTITHNYSDIQSPIKAEIATSNFDVWVAEHFLVKDVEGQPGMATFELVY